MGKRLNFYQNHLHLFLLLQSLINVLMRIRVSGKKRGLSWFAGKLHRGEMGRRCKYGGGFLDENYSSHLSLVTHNHLLGSHTHLFYTHFETQLILSKLVGL